MATWWIHVPHFHTNIFVNKYQVIVETQYNMSNYCVAMSNGWHDFFAMSLFQMGVSTIYENKRDWNSKGDWSSSKCVCPYGR